MFPENLIHTDRKEETTHGRVGEHVTHLSGRCRCSKVGGVDT